MTVVTPSYRADYDLCVDLNRTVLQFAPECVEHHILVPRADFSLFKHLGGPRTRIRCREELLPSSFLRFPLTEYLINLRWPLVPVRGWIEQQLVKLAAAAGCTNEVVLIVDSDVQFVRPFSADTFLRDGCVRFYRLPDGVDAQLPHHIRWHKGARKLLGLPPAAPPYADYISSMVACNPSVVRRMLEHVENSTGLSWPTAIGMQVHFSEWTLYGVFMDELAGPAANAFVSDQPLCPGDWSTKFSKETADEFLSRLRPDDVAAMMSSKTGTPLGVRRAAFADLRARWNRGVTIAATVATQVSHPLADPSFFSSFI